MNTWIELIALAITVVIILLIGYLISVSDLPDWFKFFLLK
jgi:hypothetical protein